MNSQRLCLQLFIFMLPLFGANSQSVASNSNFENWEVRLAKSGLDATTIIKIKKLISSHNQDIARFQKEQEEQMANYPILFHNPETTTKYYNQQFVKSLSAILSLSEFKQLFLPQFEFRIQQMITDKLTVFKQRYTFAPEQETQLKKLLYETSANEIATKEYYNYDDNLSWNNYTEEKIKSSDKERELIKSFGLFYSKNTKTDTLIKKLKEAKVDSDRINQILYALQVLQERNDKRLKTWRENDAANAFNFHDPDDDEYAIYLVFREELSRILKVDEFKSVFVSQMQNRILRDTQKEFATLKTAYSLIESQYTEIQKLVLDKNTEKVVTEEYYKYSWDLYQQKLRAEEYRYEKGIREAIQKFYIPKP